MRNEVFEGGYIVMAIKIAESLQEHISNLERDKATLLAALEKIADYGHEVEADIARAAIEATRK